MLLLLRTGCLPSPAQSSLLTSGSSVAVWAELRRGEKDNESENKRQSEFHILCAAILKLSEWEVI